MQQLSPGSNLSGRPPGAAAPSGAAARAARRWARPHDEHGLLARYRRDGDPAVRAALVERFMPLATRLARRYGGGGEPLDDLIQVASVGLLKAIDRFDPDRGTAFSTFAVPTILGELKRHFRDKGWSVRVPRDLQELQVRLDAVTEQLIQATGRTPTVDEIARRLGVSAERVLEAREAGGAHRAVSLDEPLRDDDRTPMASTIGVDDPGYDRAESAAMVEHLMRVLDPRERELLRLRFVEDLTQSEIGARMGISQMHVSRLIRQSIERLRDARDGV